MSKWSINKSLKIRVSSMALGIIPLMVVLGWLGIWMPASIRTVMLTSFDLLGSWFITRWQHWLWLEAFFWQPSGNVNSTGSI